MSEEQTFKMLKRIPVNDMIILYEEAQHTMSPLLATSQMTFETYAFRLRALEVHIMRDKLLKENGWTVEEFFAAVEKQAIIEEVEKLNAAIQFPQEIIDRAKAIFPNMVFTQAKIEL